MIAAVRGVLEGKTIDSALVTVGGITLRILSPLSTLNQLTVGQTVHLQTLFYVREDVMSLFGFATAEDRETFEQLLAVGGVGPRIGLALLSALSSEGLRQAVLDDDVVRLTMAPGVGKKLAARLVLELRPRFERLGLVGVGASGTGGTGGTPGSGNVRAQVADALTGLGYTPAQAASAVRNLPTDTGDSLEDLIMRALRLMASE
ncbi:MAG: Holliday junction branch migration protein RuvA [Chloroflexi bacterium]|nr:MAG: Holliday junction branch migration protein RuvA [Chloroflexota bacterium]